MSKHYYQIEAVNLDNIVFDTEDVSCIRGGSFFLLDTIDSFVDSRFKVVQAGGSIGIYQSDLEPASALPVLQKYVDKVLAKELGGQATFLIASTPVVNFTDDLVKLQNNIRLQQAQRTSAWFNPAELTDKGGQCVEKACAENGLLPGSILDERDSAKESKSGQWLSKSVHARHKGGAKLRTRYFEKYTGIKDISLTENLQDLVMSKFPDGYPWSPSMSIMSKMAVIHLDGNDFGAIARSAKSTEARLKFNQAVDGARDKFLKTLIIRAKEDQKWQCLVKSKDGGYVDRLRIEALMLGGDEMTFVVPAWCGFDFLEIFYDSVKGLKFGNLSLTWAAGIVFCNHKSPLLNIRSLADRLVNKAKCDFSDEKSGTRQKGNAFYAMPMETFDSLPEGVESYFTSYLGLSKASDQLCSAAHFSEFKNKHLAIRKIPRSQIYASVKSWLNPKDKSTPVLEESHDENALCAAYEKLLKRVEGDSEPVREVLLKLQKKDIEMQKAFWLQHTELVDYIAAGGEHA
jgi:hypothetical protein